MRLFLLSLCGALALGVVALLCLYRFQQRTPAVTASRAQWAIRRVHATVFPSFPLADVGCFTLRPGHTTTRVFVVDPSYTDYQTVRCDEQVTRAGQAYLVTITQSWDDAHAPTASGLLGWVERRFYKPPRHSWLYRVLPGGVVIVLPEQGPPTPQSYVH